MNLVIIAGKRSVRPLETALKKSEQTVTVGKYTAVKPNTAAEIFEKYRPHGILISDDAASKGVSLIDFLSIVKCVTAICVLYLFAITPIALTNTPLLYIR